MMRLCKKRSNFHGKLATWGRQPHQSTLHDRFAMHNLLIERHYSLICIQCMENCFWELVHSLDAVSCLIPSLMTKEANVTKPVCADVKSKWIHIQKLWNVQKNEFQELKSCNCLKRCKLLDYRVSVDPTSSFCDGAMESYVGDGVAFLFFSFPSNRVRIAPSFSLSWRRKKITLRIFEFQVPRFWEKERVTFLDLLSNIGGIVGVCLGVSLITVFDIIQGVYSRFCRISCPRKWIILAGVCWSGQGSTCTSFSQPPSLHSRWRKYSTSTYIQFRPSDIQGEVCLTQRMKSAGWNSWRP